MINIRLCPTFLFSFQIYFNQLPLVLDFLEVGWKNELALMSMENGSYANLH